MGSCCSGDQSNPDAVLSQQEASNQDDEKVEIPQSKAGDAAPSLRSDTGASQEITIRIIQAQNLPPADVIGTCDPYVIVSAGGKKFQTSVIKKNLNPIWNDDVVISGRELFSKVKDLTFDVYDWDRFSKNDHLGHFEIHFGSDLTECETPALWYGLVDKNGKEVKDAEVQVQIQIRRDINVISARNYTHILQFTVHSGHDLQNMDWIENGDPYCSVEVGRQVFRTKAVKNSKNPVWNQSLYLFVDTDTQRDYQLAVNVLDKDLHCDDHVGTGYIPIREIFDSKNRTFEGDIELQERIINLDKSLGNIPVSPRASNADIKLEEKKNDKHHCGRIKIAAQLIPRRKIEKEFFEHLLTYFDVNNDGKLAKSEVAQMLMYLEISQSVEEFMKRFDEDYDEVLDKDEVIKMLRDSKFQESDDAAKFILYHLQQDPKFNPFSSKLMEGFFREDLNEATASKTLQIRSRKTGIIVSEHIPGYINFALNAMYDNATGRILSETKRVQKILHKMSNDKGKEMDSPESRKQIATFIATHNLDETILVKKREEFATFNDFFARAIRHEECRPMSEDATEVVSPADCRMMVFNNIYDSNFWIKGNQFSIDKLFGAKRKDMAPIYEGGPFCIARLAPQDYHRWHWPVSGKITAITPIDGALFTVNPIAVNRNVNVYTENKRCVVEMETEHHGKMVMFVIAAAMVGSYTLLEDDGKLLKVGSVVKRGDVSGEFRFGGSTILLLFERNKIEFKEDLISSTNEKLETLIEVRDTIGGLPGKTNISDMVKQFSG